MFLALDIRPKKIFKNSLKSINDQEQKKTMKQLFKKSTETDVKSFNLKSFKDHQINIDIQRDILNLMKHLV